MGAVKGANHYEKFKAGKPLTRKQAMLALCYECNGFEESGADCGAKNCPIYQYHPHRGKRASTGLKRGVLDAIEQVEKTG